MEVKLLDITDDVFLYYRENIGRNKKSDRETIRKKLTRNKMMSIPVDRDDYGFGEAVAYSYGNMRFLVQDNTVQWVKNHQKRLPMWYKDIKLHRDIGSMLEIYE